LRSSSNLEGKSMTISDLFIPEPKQWGLRGDPYLWREMKEYLNGIPLPDSEGKLRIILTGVFHKLVGQKISVNEMLQVDRYNQGGMSSGMVSTVFWIDTAFPIIIDRYIKKNEKNNRDKE